MQVFFNLFGLVAFVLPVVCGSQVLGKWGDIIEFPLIPVAAFIPTEFPESNRLLVYSASENFTFSGPLTGQTNFAEFNYRTGGVSYRMVANTHHDMFCPGMSTLADERIVITGGNNANVTTIYEPSTNSFVQGAKMNIPRGYQAQTTLSDGKIFVIGGSFGTPAAVTLPPDWPRVGVQEIGNKDGEIYDPETDSWSLLSQADSSVILTNDVQGEYAADNHPWLFAWRNGFVFHAGPSKAMHWFDTANDGATKFAGVRDADSDAMNGVHAMYDVGKIFTAGGGPQYTGAPALNRSYIITIDEPNVNPTVERLPDMHFAREYANVVVLPNGQLLITGGQTVAAQFTDTDAVLVPELFDPVTKTFTLVANETEARNYHSVSLLLSDARVFTAGGGLCPALVPGSDFCRFRPAEWDHPTGQIYSPPYLFATNGSEAVRPVISDISATKVVPGDSLDVTVDGKDGIDGMEFVFVRIGSATHTVNSDQRRIPLQVDSTVNQTATLALPDDSGVLLPGPYYLFALSAGGVPSIAKTVSVRLP